MLVVRAYEVNWKTGIRSDKTQDGYCLIGRKDGVLRDFNIDPDTTVRDTLVWMVNLGYKPAYLYDVAEWVRSYLDDCRKWEDEVNSSYVTHMSIRDITELDVKPEQLYLYLDR